MYIHVTLYFVCNTDKAYHLGSLQYSYMCVYVTQKFTLGQSANCSVRPQIQVLRSEYAKSFDCPSACPHTLLALFTCSLAERVSK